MRFSVGYYFHYREHFCDPVQTVFKLIYIYTPASTRYVMICIQITFTGSLVSCVFQCLSLCSAFR